VPDDLDHAWVRTAATASRSVEQCMVRPLGRPSSADEAGMAKRSLRGLLRKKRSATSEKKAMTPQMRELMATFEAQYGQSYAHDKRGQQEPERR
jgi:hypothetical protein